MNNSNEQLAQLEDQRTGYFHHNIEIIANNIPHGALFVFELNMLTDKYKVRYVSSQWERITGVSSEVMMEDFSSVYSILHPDDLPVLLEDTKLSAQQQTELFMELRHIIHGETRWLQVSATPNRDGEWNVWEGVVLDITSYKVMEKALKEEKLWLDTIRNNLPDGVLHRLEYNKQTKKYRMAYLGATWETITGIPINEIMADIDAFFSRVIPDDLSLLLQKLENCIQAPPPQPYLTNSGNNLSSFVCEFRIIVHGQIRWLHVSSHHHHDGDLLLWDGIVLDITTRKKTEYELATEKKRLQILGDNIPGGALYQFDFNTRTGKMRLTYVSGTWESVTGIPADIALKDVGYVFDRFNPDDLPDLKKKIIDSSQTMSDFSFETTLCDRWVTILARPRREGFFVVWDGILTDITSRKRIEQELASEKKRLQMISDNLPQGALFQTIYDKRTEQTRLSYVSASWEEVTGIPADAALEDMSNVFSRIYDKALPEHLDHIANSKQTLTDLSDEVSFGDRCLNIVGRPRSEGPYIIWDGFILNITEQVNTRQSLKIERDRLVTLGNNIPQAALFRVIYEQDTGRFYMDYVSATWKTVIGLELEDVKQDMSKFFANVHPEDLQYLLDETDKSRINLTVFRVEIRMYINGKIIWINISSEPYLQDGKVIWDGIMSDVTERKMASIALIKYRDNLEKIVQERTTDLATANEELQSTMEQMAIANEELEAANEELFSTNEELHKYRTQLEEMVVKRTGELQNSQQNLQIINLHQQTLINVLKIMRTTDNLDEALYQSIEKIGKFTNVSRVHILENNNDKNCVSAIHEWCNDGFKSINYSLQNIPHAIFKNWFDFFKTEGNGVYFADISEARESHEQEIKELFDSFYIKSTIALPLIINNTTYGYLVLSECNYFREWDKDVQSLLLNFSDFLSNTIQRHNAVNSMHEQNQRLSTLINVLHILQTEDNLSNAVHNAISEIGQHTALSRVNLFVKNAEGNAFSNTYEWCNEGFESTINILKDLPISLFKGWMDRFDSGDIINTSDLSGFPDEVIKILKTHGVKTVVVLPLTFYSEHFGFITFEDFVSERTFHQKDLAMLNIFTQVMAAVIRRQQSEKSLRLSQQTMRMVLDNIDANIFLTDFETSEFIFVNQKFTEIYGDVTGKKCWQVMQNRMNGECPFCPRKKILDSDNRPTNHVYQWEYFNDYCQKWYECKDTAIEWIDGRLAHLQLDSDIDDRKLAEMELIQAKNKAEESDKLKSAFLSNISHEIRTPLNHINGFLQILDSSSDEDPVRKEFMNEINKSSALLMKLIDNVIDVAKIDSQQMTLNPRPFDLNALMQDIFSVIESKQLADIKENISLILDESNFMDPCIIHADEHRLRQILENLIDNALKFTKKGYIRFGYLRSAPEELRFFVEDTGIGLNIEQQELIFDFFRQVDTGINRQYSGIGIGLTISRSLVQMHGGEFWVKSTEGEGATFYFTIPYLSISEESMLVFYNEPPAIISENKEESLEKHSIRKTIIVVEPNYLKFNFYQKLISSLTDATVIMAESIQHWHDMIIHDIIVPELVIINATVLDDENMNLFYKIKEFDINMNVALIVPEINEKYMELLNKKQCYAVLEMPVGLAEIMQIIK